MNPSALLSPPSSAPQRSILHSQFLNPIPLRSTAALPRRRFRVSFPRNSSAQSDGATSAPPPADVFGGKRELTGVQPLVGKLSPPLRFVTSAIVLAGAAAAGYGLGLRVGKTQNTALGGAVVLGAAGGAAVYALNASAPAVAAVDLHNYVAGRDDPRDVRKDEIEGIAKK